MVAPYFLPRRRVGALRPFKFAIHLREYGWEPHILTIASKGALTAKEKRLLGDVAIYELKPPFDHTGRSGSQLRQTDVSQKVSSFSIGDWIDKHFPVDTWLPFFMLKFRQIKAIVREVAPDALWSTGDPWSAHWVGEAIARSRPDLFWMADFRDPWTLSVTNLKKRSAISSAIDQKVERKLIRRASMLSFTTNSTRKLYTEHYNDLKLKTTTIYNSFDPELFNDKQQDSVELEINPEHLNIVFFGRFRRLSTAKPITDILYELKKMNPSIVEKITIHSFGSLSHEDHSYAATKGVEHCFVVQEPVPVEQGLQILQQADLLLLSTNPDRTDIIPAKLWDYLAAGRPILSIAPNEEIKQILDETGAGVQYPYHNVEQAVKLLSECAIAKGQGQEMPIPFSCNQRKIEQYSSRSATQKLANILDHHTA